MHRRKEDPNTKRERTRDQECPADKKKRFDVIKYHRAPSMANHRLLFRPQPPTEITSGQLEWILVSTVSSESVYGVRNRLLRSPSISHHVNIRDEPAFNSQLAGMFRRRRGLMPNAQTTRPRIFVDVTCISPRAVQIPYHSVPLPLRAPAPPWQHPTDQVLYE